MEKLRGLRGKVELGGMVGRKQGSKDGESYDERIQGRIKSEGGDGERGQYRERWESRTGSFNWSLYPWVHHYFIFCLTFVRLTYPRTLQLFDTA